MWEKKDVCLLSIFFFVFESPLDVILIWSIPLWFWSCVFYDLFDLKNKQTRKSNINDYLNFIYLSISKHEHKVPKPLTKYVIQNHKQNHRKTITIKKTKYTETILFLSCIYLFNKCLKSKMMRRTFSHSSNTHPD